MRTSRITIKKSSRVLILMILMLGTTGMVTEISASGKGKKTSYEEQYIFPFQSKHVHSSSIVELPNGDLLSCWFEGSGERSANDVAIMGARLKKGEKEWSKTFVMADTPGHPDCNPVLFLNKEGKLFLFWIVVQANKWETSVLKYRTSDNFLGDGAPKWDWQDVILLKPDDNFAKTIKEGFKKVGRDDLTWAEYAPKYEDMIYKAALDKKKRETGWMTRITPFVLESGRILLPLYSDGFNMSLVAISDDNGETWTPSLPIVGRGNIQPAIVQKKDGTLVAYMRDNGDAPTRIMISESTDEGYSWTAVEKTELLNPGASVDAIMLKSGRWLMVYNDLENGRNSLAVSLSEDEGKTWKYTRHLDKMADGEGSFAYPTAIQAKDGKIHVTYSYHLKGKKGTIKHVAFTEKWVKSPK